MITDPLKADNAFIDPGQGRNFVVLSKPLSGKCVVPTRWFDDGAAAAAIQPPQSPVPPMRGHAAAQGLNRNPKASQ